MELDIGESPQSDDRGDLAEAGVAEAARRNLLVQVAEGLAGRLFGGEQGNDSDGSEDA